MLTVTLTVSLDLSERDEVSSLWMDGSDVPSKGSFNFFRSKIYYTVYSYILIYIYKKKFLTNLLWVLNFGQVGGPNKKIKNNR